MEKACGRSEGDEGMKGIKKMQNNFPLNLNSFITSWMVRGSIRGRDKRVFSKTSRPAVDPTQHPVQWVPGFFPEGNIHLVLRVRMGGAIHLFPYRHTPSWCVRRQLYIIFYHLLVNN